MSTNKPKRNELYEHYGKECMFTGVKTDLTYHHIDKAAEGGPTTKDNGAILSSISQAWLHNYIELNDPSLYDLINECLVLYKMVIDQGHQDLIEQYRTDVIPKFIDRIVAFDRRNMNRSTRTLVKRKER